MINLALTGAHFTGKTTYAELITQELENRLDTKVISLPSVPRLVHQLTGFDPKKVDNDEFQLYGVFFRRLMMLEARPQGLPIVSERCAIDEAAYQLYRLNDLNRQKITQPLLVMGKEPQEIEQRFLLAAAAMQVIIAQASVEAMMFWDRIYYCPPFSSTIEDDGVRPTDPQYQKDLATIFEDMLFGPQSSSAFSQRIRRVPTDLAEAKKFFTTEAEEWMQLVEKKSSPSSLLSS